MNLKPGTTPWGSTGYITYKRTYARPKKDGTTEEFPETIERVLTACQTQLKCGFTESELNKLKHSLLTLKGAVAGRFMWQLGTRTVKDLGLASLQNCAFTTVNEPIKPFTWAMDMLMLGSGVGYNIQQEFVYELPKVRRAKVVRQDTKDADFIVPDSREGWVGLLERLLEAHYLTGKGFTYSTICIRSKGAPIKGFGGVASGPEELCWGIREINKVLNNRAGKKTRPIDALDIMNIIGAVVVAGNVRRSAQLAIGDMDDRQFLNAKRWDLGSLPNWRAMSNNSVVCNDIQHLPDIFWEGYKGNGEPYGLINLGLARSVGRLTDGSIYPDPAVMGFNPCLHPDTLVETVNGRVKIKDITEPTYVYSMDSEGKLCIAKSSASWVSKKNTKTLKITINSGATIQCTPDHKIFTRNKGWIEAQELEIRDEVVHLARTRRGACYAGVRLTTQSTSEQVMEHRLIYEGVHGIVPENVHHKNGRTYDNRLDNLEGLSHSDHCRLTAMEQANNHQVRGPNGDFISGPEELKTNLINKPFITSIEWGETVDVYDLTVKDTHNFVANNIIVHNCAEQSLADKETCCLSEIFLPNIESKQEFFEVAKLLYRVNKHSLRLGAHHESTKSIVHQNMRMGIGITGVCQALDKLKWCDVVYKELREYDKVYSKEKGWPESIKLTTVKPSGTLSLLAGVTPGCHPGYSSYFIRRIRIANNSRLLSACRTSGYRVEPVKNFDGSEDHQTSVVEFPCKYPEGTLIAENMSAIEQLNIVRRLQDKWSDNSVSCTIYYKLEELPDIQKWLKAHYNKNVKTVSFLLHSEHGFVQAPYEAITKEQYEELTSKIVPITGTEVTESDFELEECNTGACPIK